MIDVQNQNSLPDLQVRTIPRPVCLLCGTQGHPLYAELTDWLFGAPGTWNLRQCSTCLLAWLDPQPLAEDIPKLYLRYYTHSSGRPKTLLGPLRDEILQCSLARMGYPVTPSNKLLPRALSQVPSIRRDAVLEVLNLNPSQAGSLLDVGCGNGVFISRMRSLGWTVSGVDPDPSAIRYCRAEGLQVFGSSIRDVPNSQRFDFITLNHVIEHVSDPVDLLSECRQRLRPGSGCLILTTPNIESLGHRMFKGYWRGLEIPRHLSVFSAAALRECFIRAGLQVQLLRTEARLAHMIYAASACAQAGGSEIGERINAPLRTKLGAYFFRSLEDLLMVMKPGAGEELFCVCSAPKEN
jgi:2-polyprenyl-3-methyl-5-hydroxy-6-metoxy-1,4-benzoquinol methylase